LRLSIVFFILLCNKKIRYYIAISFIDFHLLMSSCVVDAGHVPCGSGSGSGSDSGSGSSSGSGSGSGSIFGPVTHLCSDKDGVLRQAVKAWAQAEDKGAFLSELVQSTKGNEDHWENVVLHRLCEYNRAKVSRLIGKNENKYARGAGGVPIREVEHQREHTLELMASGRLVLLCPNCHFRYDNCHRRYDGEYTEVRPKDGGNSLAHRLGIISGGAGWGHFFRNKYRQGQCNQFSVSSALPAKHLFLEPPLFSCCSGCFCGLGSDTNDNDTWTPYLL
jgi:hypothetical protein